MIYDFFTIIGVLCSSFFLVVIVAALVSYRKGSLKIVDKTELERLRK